MNKVILMGRLTRDPDVRWTQGQDQKCMARFTLAVDRHVARTSENQVTADFISCVAFGNRAEFVEKYLRQGTKICADGRIQTGSYTNRDGQKVYTTDVVIENLEFAESKGGSSQAQGQQSTAPNWQQGPADADGFMNIPAGVDEELPFS